MRMYCPYMEPTLTIIEQFAYDAAGRLTQKITIERYAQPPCVEEKCKAYINEECTFAE